MASADGAEEGSATVNISLQELRRQQGAPKAGQAPVRGSAAATPLVPPQQQESGRSSQSSSSRGMQVMDPIFGPAEVPAHQLSPTPLQMIGLCLCPCCVLRGATGCCCGFHQLTTPRMREVWRRLFRRAALWLCLLDILVFVIEIIVNGVLTGQLFQPLSGKGSNPMIGPAYETLVAMGSKDMPRMVYEHQWWRLVLPMILHVGILHILFNLMATFRMGLVMEEKWGTKVWLAIYLVSGVAGSLCSCAFRPQATGVGASGSLFGLFGGFTLVTLFPSGNEDPMERYMMIVSCISGTVMGVAISLAPLVDWSAHLGGWIAGFWLAAIMLLPESSRAGGGASIWRKLNAKRQTILSVTFAFVLVILLIYVVFIVPVKPHWYQRQWMRDHGQYPPKRCPSCT
mmetsp:Transcript_29219/g.67988  ORF Transcript_29219/g.67988 Transcript_29219/m.67988 type:complete len:399 (+) Transcript_29219:102-1298(+)